MRAPGLAGAVFLAGLWGCVTSRVNWEAPLPPSRLLLTLKDGSSVGGEMLAVSDDAVLLQAPEGERCVSFGEVQSGVIRLSRPPVERTTSVPVPRLGGVLVRHETIAQEDVVRPVVVDKMRSLKQYAVWKDRPVRCERAPGGASPPMAP